MARMHPHRHEGLYEFLRASVDITDVLDAQIGEKVWCVFHEETEPPPSMHLYENSAYCFACGEYGDVTKVWKAKHGFATMWEAAQDLARKFNLELPKISPEAKSLFGKGEG